MGRTTDWWDTWPRWLRWGRLPVVLRWIIGVAAVAISYPLALTLVAVAFPGLSEFGVRLVLLAIAVTLAVVGYLRARRMAGGKEQARLLRQATRTGILPEGADVDRWRPLLRRQEQTVRGFRGVNRVVWAALTLVVTATAVFGGLVHGPRWWTFLIGTAVIALVGWLFDRFYGRLHARTARLVAEADATSTSTPPS